jgi:hypothetical protein
MERAPIFVSARTIKTQHHQTAAFVELVFYSSDEVVPGQNW